MDGELLGTKMPHFSQLRLTCFQVVDDFLHLVILSTAPLLKGLFAHNLLLFVKLSSAFIFACVDIASQRTTRSFCPSTFWLVLALLGNDT